MGIFIHFLCITQFTLSLASCSKDDEESSDGSIVGIWKVEEYALNGAKMPIAPEDLSYSEFKNNGTVVTYELDEDGNKINAGWSLYPYWDYNQLCQMQLEYENKQLVLAMANMIGGVAND